MEELGYALRLARERRGLTQTQVMNLTGINNKTLSGYENNIAEPDLQTLTTLLRLYRVSADRLLHLPVSAQELPADEVRLLTLYRAFPEEQPAAADAGAGDPVQIPPLSPSPPLSPGSRDRNLGFSLEAEHPPEPWLRGVLCTIWPVPK